MLDADLKVRDGIDHSFYAQYNKIDMIRNAIVCYENNKPVGCGAFKAYDDKTVELKRMFVHPDVRGKGIGKLILHELEKWAAELNYTHCILETGKKQPEAIRLYESSGYGRISNFGQYANVDNSVCMKKAILILVLICMGIFSFAQDKQVEKDTIPRFQSLQEVVILASRLSESKLSAPVSISKLSGAQIISSPNPSFFDAIGSMKGVHMIIPSLGFKIINTRGFSNTTNVRFVQLIDNVDNQSPHIGAPIASALSPGDLDIEHVEIIQGVASALYGMNATNGLANFTTKDPFTYPGLSIQQQVGINHISDPGNIPSKIYNETNLRWAHVLGKKWAFKINAGFMKGYDWIADNKNDLNPNANLSTGLTGDDNPAYDPVNGYGNESSNRESISLNGKNYVVARTGYFERDVADYHLQNWKGDAAIFYRPNDNTNLSYTYRMAHLNNIYQRSNRFRLENYLLQQHIVQYKSKIIGARIYYTSENTGDSYNLRSMAENIDYNFKNTNTWYAGYTEAFNSAIEQNTDVAAAHRSARSAADNGRLQPGTEEFNDQIDYLRQINNWDMGAALKVKAHMFHSEATVDLGKVLHTKFNLLGGGDFRDYIIVPDGNYFINPTDSGKNLHYTSFGVFVQASENFLNNKLQVSAALRASAYEYFSLKWNPRFTMVYEVGKNNFARFSYQNGYRFASIFEGFSNINSGGVKRVGGLKVMSDGIFENSWLKSSIDDFVAAVNKDVNTEGISQTEALDKNKNLLQKNTYTYLKPEQMHSFEVGYRSLLYGGRLMIDGDVYYNFYSNFIAQIEASIPNTDDPDQMPASLYDRNKQARYRLWTNSKSLVHNYGAELDVRYLIDQRYSIFANGSYQALKRTSQNDGLEDGFNTPGWIVNAGLNANDIISTFGFAVSVKYQNSYYWQSFLINGTVPSIFTANAAVNYSFVKPSIRISLGASNIFNRYYHSILGGPRIGGMYYTTVTYDLFNH